MNVYRRGIVHVIPGSLLFLTAVSSQAASSTKVDQSAWQGGVSLPSYVNMYIYIPDNRATKPPILVASHHCQGTAASTYNETKSNFVSQADKNGYIIIFPEATGHNCWDVGSTKALKHDGGGDTHAIAQMVRYTITKYDADASRVYAFGGSSGGMMTEALLGIYPDIFTAGVAVSGVPCGCWSAEYSGDVATNGQWSNPCAGGTVTKTAQAWGDQVRSMFPGFSGHRARVQLWHGDPDDTISFVNFGEAIKEWTNVLGLSSTPTKTDNPSTSTTHQTWNSACGFKVLETFAIKGAGHAVQWDLATASSFLGLDKAGGQDPELAACSGAGGAGGAGGSGGSGAGTAGSATAGSGATAMGGSKAAGGKSSVDTTSGGARASGGSGAFGAATGGTTSEGGVAAGGTTTTGTTASGTSTGGVLTNSGSNTTGGRVAEGGTTATNGTTRTGPSMTGTSTTGGAVSNGGTSASGGVAVSSSGGSLDGIRSEGENPGGCTCAMPGQRFNQARHGILWLVLSSLALSLRGRKRRAA